MEHVDDERSLLDDSNASLPPLPQPLLLELLEDDDDEDFIGCTCLDSLWFGLVNL